MEEHLTIRNFGPIREADIAVRDLTIFVGPQATGKSLAAQVLYFLRGIEDLLLPEALLMSHSKSEIVLSAFESWLGHTLSLYVSHRTHLRWASLSQSKETVHELEWGDQEPRLNDALRNLVRYHAEVLDAERLGLSYSPGPIEAPKQIYIPAGRALYSFIPSYSRLYLQLAPQWPGYVSRFYETLGTALAKLWQEREREQLANSDLNLPGEPPDPNWLQQHIASIMKGQLEYSRDSVALTIGAKRFKPTAFAAGQMEIWPFCAIVQAGFDLATRVYFEEPEAHLHPGAQRSIMEAVAFLVQQGTQFLITTHSPYVLYAVNNFLMAQKVLDAGRTLPDDVSSETVLRPDQVAAYRFAPDGTIHNIMDAKVGLIDGDELEQVAEDLGSAFTDLQERLEGWT
ncbi:MAG: AAA family ATPase [Chloroflexi bacterium]|nr:AAA family ATPase [Chloroflexota bacterium]MBU1748677.1 AAA family ATPase [Chloroflexota bacterium]